MPVASVRVAVSDSDETGNETGTRQLRLFGVGFAFAGAVTVALGNAASPGSVLVPLLGFSGVGAYVLEKTQGYEPGISFGLLIGGMAVALWPTVGDPTLGYAYLGSILLGAGVVNVLVAPVGGYFRRLGERAAGRGGKGEQE
jgi:hypothetical protein